MLPRRAIPTDASGLPDKPYFKIGEAARMCAVKPYVLRYWESEFTSIRPQKSRSQQRLYRRRDVELLLEDPAAALREALHHRGRPGPPARARPRRGAGAHAAPLGARRQHGDARKIKQELADSDTYLRGLTYIGAWRSLVSAPDWGSGGRWFKSSRPDKESRNGRAVAPPVTSISTRRRSRSLGAVVRGDAPVEVRCVRVDGNFQRLAGTATPALTRAASTGPRRR